jgi:hypothetical protein
VIYSEVGTIGTRGAIAMPGTGCFLVVWLHSIGLFVVSKN